MAETQPGGPARPAVLGRVQLDQADGAALSNAMARLPSPRPPQDMVLTPSIRAVLDRHLMLPLNRPLRKLRHPQGSPALIIDGLPIIDEIGPTPVDGRSTDDRLPATKAIVTWIVETMGVFLVGHPQVGAGRYFHDVNPVQETEDREPSPTCGWARSPACADYLLLWSIRSAPMATVLTGYCEAGRALARLSTGIQGVLREPRFRIRSPTGDDPMPGTDPSPVALVTGPSMAPEIGSDPSRVECLDPQARIALNQLTGALEAVTADVELTTGRVLIVDQRRGAVRRDGFTPTYGPDERWLLRCSLLTDPWVQRRSVLEGGIRVGLDEPGPAR